MLKTLIFVLFSFPMFNFVFAENQLNEKFSAQADSLKGKVFYQYNNYIKNNGKVAGKVVFNISLNSKGEVEHCSTYASELNAPNLEQSVCNILKSKVYSGFGKRSSQIKYNLELISI